MLYIIPHRQKKKKTELCIIVKFWCLKPKPEPNPISKQVSKSRPEPDPNMKPNPNFAYELVGPCGLRL